MSPVDLRSNPFPGLRPFELEEAYLFFGRDGQSDEILRRLRRHHFLAVLGTSGSGKSSLIRAGLLPSLYGGLMAHTGSRWRVAIFRPGKHPIGSLAAALGRPGALGTVAPADDASLDSLFLESTLRRSAVGLVEVVRQAQLEPGENLLIVVDQMEELFRFTETADALRQEDEAAAFVKLLLEGAAQPDLPIYVVITMRSDFIGECARFRSLPEAVNEGLYLIPRMTRKERKEVITGPVAVGGGEIAPRLVSRLMNEMGDSPDQLPILQHALMRTWDWWACNHDEGEPLDFRHYEAVGGMAEALSRHADEAYRDLPDDRHREIAKRLFQALTEKGADNREVRRPTSIAAIMARTGADRDAVLLTVDAFRRPGRSFLMPPSDVPLEPDSVIDISHESLIRGWKELKGWVDEEVSSALIFRRLAETALLHQQGKAALWSDPDLQVALAWREKEDPNAVWAARYHLGFKPAMTFLDASVAARERVENEERRRRDRELRRTRLFAAVLAVALLLSLALGATVLSLRESAVTAENEAVTAESVAVTAEREARTQAASAQRQAEIAHAQTAYAQRAQAKAAAQTDIARRQSALASASEQRARASAEDARQKEQKASAAQALADQRRQEADLAAGDLRHEVLRSRDVSLADNQEIYNLANILTSRSAPLAMIYPLLMKAHASTVHGNHSNAIELYTEALETDPQNPDALLGRGYESLLVGTPERTIEDTQKYLQQNQQSSTAHQNLGLAHAMTGQYALARADVDRAIENYTPFEKVETSAVAPDIREATGRRVLIEEGTAYAVALEYEIALLAGLEPASLAQLDATLAKADQDAARSINRSLDPYLIALNWAWLNFRVRPGDYGALAISGALWERAGSIQPRFRYLAFKTYSKFIAEHAANRDPRYQLLADWVAKRLRAGQFGDVGNSPFEVRQDPLELARAAMELRNRSGGDTYIDLLAGAEHLLTDAIRMAGTGATPQHDMLVRLLIQRASLRSFVDDKAGAREDCNAILELEPHNARAYFLLAGTDKDDKARRAHYESALQFDPFDRDTLLKFSELLAPKDKDPARALTLLGTYLRLEPASVDARKRLVGVQRDLGRAAEALASVEIALSIAPQDLALYELRRDVEKDLGSSRKAVELHLAAGYRAAGNALRRSNKGGEALWAYLKGLETAYGVTRGSADDDDTRLESEVCVQTLTDFLASQYSRSYARTFWQNIASSNASSALRRRAAKQSGRLSTPP
jgi:energy-coupling factor transporter ATP-binding protein EcfA2